MFNQRQIMKLVSLCVIVIWGASCVSTKHESGTESQASLDASNKVDIAPSAEEVEPLKVGDSLPSFSVLTTDSVQRPFSAALVSKPTVIITYRGGWCPYCNVHLQELRKAIPSLEEMGVETVFFSGDRPEILTSSLQEQTQELLETLPYQIYSDANLEAATALGIAFEAKNTKMTLLQFVKDTKGSSLDKHTALAVPSVFVVDSTGVIRYVYFNPDYKKRLSSDELLIAVKSVL